VRRNSPAALAAALLIAYPGGACIAQQPVPVAAQNLTALTDNASLQGYRHILIDQFGYRTADVKVAVIRNPKVGYDRADTYAPGSTYQIRRIPDDTVVFSGPPVAWKKGAVQSSSGDQGWWFDFSGLRTPGRYVVYDSDRKRRSASFSIDDDVYNKVLQAAVHMFYYQRAGVAKRPPFADKCWADDAAYLGPNQDSQAHDVTDPTNYTKRRDMSGGWSDAGDTNRYVTFAVQPVHQLLTAYAQNPGVFPDNWNIPESGNGIPDVLDEVRWETSWLKKMQFTDGGVALKIGERQYAKASPPSADRTFRYYVPACTSATIAAAGMFAHAAHIYSRFASLAGEVEDLKARAIKSWNLYQSTPARQIHCDTGAIHGGNADWSADDQAASSVVAAVYLSAITGSPVYHDYVKAHYRETRPYHDFGWTRYSPEQGDALLFYTTLDGADPEVKRQILADKSRDVTAGNKVYGFNPDDDLYRAFLHDEQYHWGSNNPRANYGSANLDVPAYGLSGKADPAGFRLRALEILHYFHGVNPLAMVYLTNMYSLGVTHCANEIFHTWFQPYTRWSDAKTSECGPAPGYVPGGPNRNAAASGVPAWVSPPVGQPPQKSYRDWNGPDASWAVTEPGIYYQSAYVRLLAAFAHP
jgi:endoglucanase